MIEPSIAAIVEIGVDQENESYHTRSYLEVDKKFAETTDELPRDVLLAMVYELQVMLNNITERAKIEDSELCDYIKERQIVKKEDRESPKDNIDTAIDHLFEDDED